MVIFKSKQKKLEADLKIKLCSKRLLLSCLGSESWHYSTNCDFTKTKAVRTINFQPRNSIYQSPIQTKLHLKLLRSA